MSSLAKYRKVSVALMLLALLQCGGLHWVGLYTASRAIQNYQTVRSTGWLAAVQRLPKGSGNCGFCQKIQSAKTNEDKQKGQQQTVMQQLQGSSFILDTVKFAVSVQVFHAGRSSTVLRPWHIRGETPPTPPPRLS